MLIHGIVTTINDILCPNVDVTLSDGTKLKVLSSDAPVGMDSDSTQGEALFGRKSVDRYRKPTAAEISNSGGKITADSKIYIEENPNNNYSLFTLGEIEINPEIAANKSKLPLSKNAGTKEYDIDTIGKITTKWQEAFATISPDSLIRSNFNNYYTAMITEIGNRGDQYDEMCTNQANLAGSIDNQRQETSGVSSDEELTNLIKYQHAYNASSRYITTVSDMLEHIINSLGR
jgi:flagellar hook-associated protein 1 FlgK